jgi:hypothetical protein
VETRSDWAATHTVLQKNIRPSSVFLLKSVQESDRSTQNGRQNYYALVTTLIFNITTANMPLDTIINQFLPLL